MIKDIIINLEHQVARDPARDFAISIAEVCDTHLAGVAFAYTPEFPGYVALDLPPDIVAQMTAESEKSAMVAIERFDAAAKRSLISGSTGCCGRSERRRRRSWRHWPGASISACSCNPSPVASTTMT